MSGYFKMQEPTSVFTEYEQGVSKYLNGSQADQVFLWRVDLVVRILKYMYVIEFISVAKISRLIKAFSSNIIELESALPFKVIF